MLKELSEFIRSREEVVEIGGFQLTVRELPSASEALRIAKTGEDAGYSILVACVFDAEGKQAFEDSDIPALMSGSKWKLGPLIAAVNRVNGFDTEDSAKKSETAPG